MRFNKSAICAVLGSVALLASLMAAPQSAKAQAAATSPAVQCIMPAPAGGNPSNCFNYTNGASNTSDYIAPNVTGSSSSSLTVKSSPGVLYNAYATCTAACWLMVFNATATPANGSTTAGPASGGLQDCLAIASGQTGVINYAPGPGEYFSVGITLAISSTACSTLTASGVAFIHGSAR